MIEKKSIKGIKYFLKGFSNKIINIIDRINKTKGILFPASMLASKTKKMKNTINIFNNFSFFHFQKIGNKKNKIILNFKFKFKIIKGVFF